MASTERQTYGFVLSCIGLCALFAMLGEGPVAAFKGFMVVQVTGSRLINDLTVIGGEGGALLNSAVMGFLALILINLNGVRLSGPTIACIFTIMGFSLFGKSPFNATPIVLGVFLAAKIAGKPFRNYLIMALFGTALGPLVDFVILEAGLHGLVAVPAGLAVGICAGMLIPAMAISMLRLHEGFSLYNIGLTCGFLGLFAAGILAASGHDIGSLNLVWNEAPSLRLRLLAPLLALLALVWGLVMEGPSIGKNLARILKLSGRLPSDFMDLVSPGASLVNMGILGLGGSLYLFLIGADFCGPTIGGLFTLMGFAGFGKHPRNCLPVMLGIAGATLLFGMPLDSPGPVLAILFGTTLAPLAGEFGPLVGFAAGFLHLIIVDRSSAWHGGLDLYNNGFSGGLTAALFVAVAEWLRSISRQREMP
jgi:hypothetical protein